MLTVFKYLANKNLPKLSLSLKIAALPNLGYDFLTFKKILCDSDKKYV